MKRMIQQSGRMILVILVCALVGCKSTDLAKENRLASVLITGSTDEEIRKAAKEVFIANGFEQEAAGLTFEKKGSDWDTAKYGGLSGNAVWIKMRLHLNSRGPGIYALGCDAYIVTDRHVELMEDETKLKIGKREECLNLLNQIKGRLAL